MSERNQNNRPSKPPNKTGNGQAANPDSVMRIKLIILIAIILVAIGVAIIFYFALFDGEKNRAKTNSNVPTSSGTSFNANTAQNLETGSPVVQPQSPPKQTTLRSLTEAHNDSKDMDAFFEKTAQAPEPVSFRDEDKIFSETHPGAYKEYCLGNELAAKGDFRTAHQHYINSLQAIARDEKASIKHEFDLAWLSRTYGLIAICLCEQHMYDAALAHLDEAQNLDTDLEENHVVRANIYLLTNQKAKAAPWMKKLHKGGLVKAFPAWATKRKICQLSS
jgi:hypothetical protein